MQVDYTKLHERVRSLLTAQLAPAEPPKHSIVLEIVEGVVRAETVRKDLLGEDVAITAGCDECLDFKTLKKAKVLGRGYFGVVFDVGKGRAMKVEFVQEAAAVTDGVPIAVKAGKAGIGPKVHSWRVCDCGQHTYLVIVMDKINGKTLDDWLHKAKSTKGSEARVARVRAALLSKIKKMAKVGVEHLDLHPGNIMVDAKDELWIIDFTYRARGRDNMDALKMFDRMAPKQVNQIGAIYAALEQEGTVAVTGQLQLPKKLQRNF
jgi:predicted Ser/Thr protein kinase